MLKDIIQVCKGNQTLDEEWRNARWKLRNGNLILFWEDHWCDDRPLASKLSRLYNLTQFKFLSVREFYDCWRNNKHNYSLLWGRQLIGYEISEIIQLQLILEELIFTKGDDMLLMKSTQRLFTVRYCYVVCSCQNYGVNSIWMNWSVMIPPKVCLVLWKFNHGILPLKSFLSVRLQGNFPSITCSWCRLGEENQFHLFYECELAQWAWSFISLWWDTDFSDIDVLTLDSLFRRISGDRLSKAWKVLVASVLWSIWLIRNELVFSNTRIKKKDFLSVISYQAKSWLHAAGLICEVYDHLWTQAPKDCVILSAKLQKSLFWTKLSNSSDATCVVDGSFSMGSQGVKLAGIGGYILSDKGAKLFSFSGPTIASNALEAEYKMLSNTFSKLSIYPIFVILLSQFAQTRAQPLIK